MSKLDLPHFLPFRLNRLAAEVSRRLSAIYAERFDLDIPQWRVIATLSDGASWTAQDIVASTRTHKSTISRAVQELVTRNLVARVPSAADGRALTLKLTAKGRALMERLIPLARQFEEDLLSNLGSAKAKGLEAGIGSLENLLDLNDGQEPK